MDRKRWTWTLWGLAALAALALLAWAFAPRALPVELATAAEGRFEATVDEDGKTRLAERYVVSAPLAGRLARISLREGDRVAAGDVVAHLAPVLAPLLDPRSQREASVRVEGAQAQLQRADARLARTKVAVEQARLELARGEQLAASGFIAPTQLDTQRLAREAAARELDTATQERHMAVHELEQARAAADVIRSPAAAPGRELALRAPVAGQVLRVLQVSEATLPAGTPLLELGDLARLEVVVPLLSADALQAVPGTPVRIERWGGAGVLEGRVRRVEPAAFTKVSALGVEEQRVNVLIDLTTPREQWAALGDGYRVAVRVVVKAAGRALLVPASAVFPLPGGEPGAMAVYVADGGHVRLQAVRIAARNGSHAWVQSGVAAGTRVVVYPPPGLGDGDRITERRI